VRVCEALKSLVDFFARKSIETPKTDAELLLAFVLKCKRLDLFLNYERELSKNELELLRRLSVRRGHREPLQYLLESVDFFGQTLKVDARVLIPRPETEELVYQIQQRLQGRVVQKGLDLGTGSGAIAIALTALGCCKQMVAVDVSPEALDLAYDNAAENNLTERIRFVCSSWFEKVSGTFDFIVSNPPYLTEKEFQEAQPEVRVFEPKSALVAAEDGLKDLKQILKDAVEHLIPGGFVVCETGLNQHKILKEYAFQCGYKRVNSTQDLTHRERYFWAWLN
jgi:protein-(glutamine-N5) methyltransferase, release factor-specific